MLCNSKILKGYKLDSRNGEIGRVKEFYFDDQHWTVRYLVAETGNWLEGRQVLISPHALGAINKDIHDPRIKIDLTKEQIQSSPSLISDKPISRQFEEDYYAHYGWPAYWSGSHSWGAYPYIERDNEKWNACISKKRAGNSHLRSTRDVTGYHIHAIDGKIGHIEDFIIDDETWMIRYLVISTHNWWPGKKVLLSPQWISRVSWGASKFFVDLCRENIRQSPEYTQESLLTRKYEAGLHRHYNRPNYWVDKLAAK